MPSLQSRVTPHEYSMQMRLRLRDAKGFSLTELLVVTIIIGLLATISLPLFATLQAKAHQAETRANLSGIHVAETNFFGEHQRYGNFDEIGFTLQGVSTRCTYRSPAAGGTAASTGTPNEDLLAPSGGTPTPENTVVASGATLPGAGSTGSFTATATGNLDADSTVDQWHINEDKHDLDNPDVNDKDS